MNRSRGSSSSMPAVQPLVPVAPKRAISQPPPGGSRTAPSTLPPRSPLRDLIGKKIGGKYVVRSILGEGGMGTVFEAQHEALGRAVAVKVLHPNQARKKDAVKRFHQEARAAGAIGHPNICEVYDLGTLEDGAPYLVMEKLVGETLADRIASEGGLPFDDVIDVLTQVLSGLVAAHEKRIVHRDIKPENIFLTRRVGCPPVAKLLDFGVSKVIASHMGGDRDEDLDLTRTGMVMGTPYYMSPEQARGDRNLDARVDLYACGVIMYEALTGRRPFTAANYNALLLQILTGKPRPARELRPALPHGFDQVIDKAMARAREDRFQTADEFQKSLQQLRDRHKEHPPPAAVADLARQAFSRAKPSPAVPPAPKRAIAPPPEPPPSRPRVSDDPTPSSVEIPITFSNDTPLSGENMPVEPTQVNRQRPSSDDYGEDQPTEVQLSPLRRSVEDDHTTQKRGPEFARQLASVIVEGQDVETDVGTQLMVRRPVPRSVPPDDNDTIVKPSFPRRRGAKKPPSPDDTIKMDGDLSERIEEARGKISDATPSDTVHLPRKRS